MEHAKFTVDRCDTQNAYSKQSVGPSALSIHASSAKRTVLLRGIPARSTLEDVENALGNTGVIQRIAFASEDDRSAVSCSAHLILII